MANIADNVIALQAAVAELQKAVAALPTTAGAINLEPVTTAIAGVQTTVNDIDAKLTPAS